MRPAAVLRAGLLSGFLALAASLPAGASPFSSLTQDVESIRVLEEAVVEGVAQALVSYPSDDLRVRAYLFLPGDASPRPLVLFNHGGVSGVSADMKWRSRQMARAGYVVAAPTYRGEGGSEGRVEVARGEVQDILSLTRLLAEWRRVDADRIAVSGSSHGALISVLAAAREPDLYRSVTAACGVMDVVGWYYYLVAAGFDVSDSLSVAVYGRGPLDKPDAFEVRSAIAVADHIRVPVLLQQGRTDRIVPPFQARLMRDALVRAGAEVTLLEYPRLGHAFWFWNDLRYHDQAEIDQADASWADFQRFLERTLN